ncbi:Retrovirus-related Pol polyprotein from transposon TNT 1-94 [Ceratocystis lukuohia]|uniref:Retrovirus-related Pol polyprotein from transposon TNT 1-94 n=1 Tax=Ceratocystis lukuohia TaxID=2019550 RepID=A0ABR4M9Y2_9PEZI
MATNESANLDNLTKFMMAMNEALNSQKGEFNFNSSNSNPMEAMLQNRIKLSELNWSAWSKNMIRNLKGAEVLCLFKDLKEEEFKKAMDVEKNEQQQVKDAPVALNEFPTFRYVRNALQVSDGRFVQASVD